MMTFSIIHTTEYTYDQKVFLEPHYIRFKPKATAYISVAHFDIHITPTPAGLSEQIDVEHNHNLFCWFDGAHDQLKIVARSKVITSAFNPFNFLIHPYEYTALPFTYDPQTSALLQPCLQTDTPSQAIQAFLEALLNETEYHTVNFLVALTRQIHHDFVVESRETGTPHEPELTFSQRKGSCRDLAWMQIHFLRHLGIAARFVSGYLYLDTLTPEFELHAWLEVYIPGAGWVGFDPSHGIITDNHHIPVASSAYFSHTMPVSGSFRGSAQQALHHELSISPIS